ERAREVRRWLRRPFDQLELRRGKPPRRSRVTPMPEDSAYLHEAASSLSEQTLDNHRAYRSLMEEIEAVDWYAQRVDATNDPELKAVLAHNRDEEKEHAAMVLEWLRRRDPVLDQHLRTYLFTSGPIDEIEEQAEASGEAPEHAGPGRGRSGRAAGAGAGDLRIGSLRSSQR